MSDVAWLRIGIAIALSLQFGAIIYFGRSGRGGQGRRVRGAPPPAAAGGADASAGAGADAVAEAADGTQQDLPLPAPQAELGRRPHEAFDRIVTLYVAATAGHQLRGEDIVVAAEKAGLVYGHMGIFHRLVDGRPELGPVFSVANILRPGSFDLARIGELQTPAIAFFLTLPAPVPALEAWETMEPAAQRMAQLLGGLVLDEDRNALGRQRIQHIREELRQYDRQHAAPPLGRGARW